MPSANKPLHLSGKLNLLCQTNRKKKLLLSFFFPGYQLYGNELQTFQKIPVELRLLSKVFPYDLLFMRRIYVTIRCKNKAGLQSSLSTDGVIVSNLPPVSASAQVNILPLSNTEYMAYNGYQKNKHTMRIKWSGFNDIVGLDSYLVSSY